MCPVDLEPAAPAAPAPALPAAAPVTVNVIPDGLDCVVFGVEAAAVDTVWEFKILIAYYILGHVATSRKAAASINISLMGMVLRDEVTLLLSGVADGSTVVVKGLFPAAVKHSSAAGLPSVAALLPGGGGGASSAPDTSAPSRRRSRRAPPQSTHPSPRSRRAPRIDS